jgi:hypothetical protein
MAEAVGAVIGIGSSLFGMSQQRKAMEEQEKAMKEQKRLQRTADERERRQMLRQQAIARGQTVNVAAQMGGGQGATAGTGLIGGLSGLENQGISSVNFQAITRASVNKQQKFLNNAAQYQTQAGIAEGVGALGSGLMETSFGQNFASGVGARLFPKMANPMQSYGML